MTVLHEACTWGHASTVEVLLEYGADVNIRANGGPRYYPIHSAARAGHASVVGLLLTEHPQIVDQCHQDPWTSWHEAAWWGHPAVAEILMKYYGPIAPSDNQCYTPLCRAAQGAHPFKPEEVEGKHKVAELLLKADKTKIDHRSIIGVMKAGPVYAKQCSIITPRSWSFC